MDITAAALVQSFGSTTDRFAVYEALVALGESALPAVRKGLKSDDRHVRHWSAICLDRMADAESLLDLVPLLHDPAAEVRVWAVHSLACNHCKEEVTCPVDVIPLLIDRIETDPSLKVRKMAVVMLATEILDPRGREALEHVLRHETDRRIRLHAEEGLERLDMLRPGRDSDD